MAQHESFAFKTRADKETYEAGYAERAKDHQDEEWRYVNNSQDAKLFENLQYNVFIAGFKHSSQGPGKIVGKGRNITSTALAGYCGQLYTAELMDWLSEKRVMMVFGAFQAIEKARFHTSVVDTPRLRPTDVWAQLNDPRNIDLLQRRSVDLPVDSINAINDQASMEILIRELPVNCLKAHNAIDSKMGMFWVGEEALRKKIRFVAMGIQLARFQQALLHTCNGQRFFSGKADLAGNPGCKIFEDFIEIEDLSRAAELFAFQKIRHDHKCNIEGERLNKPKDSLAQKPYFYPPSIVSAREAARLAAANGNGLAVTVGEKMGEMPNGQTLMPTNPGALATRMQGADPEARPEDEYSISRDHGNNQVREGVLGSDKPSGRPNITHEDLRILWKGQARIEEGKAKVKQKQKDIKTRMSSINAKLRNGRDKLRRWEKKLEEVRQELKGHENDLDSLVEERNEAGIELIKLEMEAKVLVSDFDLAVIKRKRDVLEQDEERIKKQKQALVDEA